MVERTFDCSQTAVDQFLLELAFFLLQVSQLSFDLAETIGDTAEYIERICFHGNLLRNTSIRLDRYY